ncbi:MAG: GNAT family N-acetyltransferase [Candidatus Saccharimonadales bacterium]
MRTIILPVTEVSNLNEAAIDLSANFRHPNNDDITSDFPGSLEMLRKDPSELGQILQERADSQVAGERERFIAFTDAESEKEGGRLQAVGIGFLTLSQGESVPPAIRDLGEPHGPNLSLMISYPFRRQGLGRLIMQRQLESVEAHCNGNAWTSVRKANIASQRLVTAVGFVVIGSGVLREAPAFHYRYNSH